MSDTHTDRPAGAAAAPEGHPINILMKEHELVLDFSGRLVNIAGALTGLRDLWAAEPHREEIAHLVDHLVKSESHYVREENVLFPVIEKHGITGPPRMMWTEHNEIRGLKKELAALIEKPEAIPFDQFAHRLHETASALDDLLASHFNKENSILFPAAMRVITEEEWPQIRRQFDELGYCCFTPPVSPAGDVRGADAPAGPAADGTVAFATGALSVAQLSALLDSLPIDVTFVDKDDTVRYFNQAADRIFPRAKAIIGRTVQNCHPSKSLDRVQAILDGFRDGTLPKAEFWIPADEKLVYIRYLPVRDAAGRYLGCLEVTQDIAPIKKIEGQKRLL
jgi:PAS domain S-box-containing protein